MRISYHKLVRDKIPEIIEQDGKKAKIKKLDRKAMISALKDKLTEESREFSLNDKAEELADVMEVFETILKYKGWTMKKIKTIQENKRKRRGSFKERWFLEYVDE